MITTGDLSGRELLMRRAHSTPFMPGIIQSIRMRSYDRPSAASRSIISIAWKPFSAVSTSRRSPAAIVDRISLALALSSTTSTRSPASSSAVSAVRRRWFSCRPSRAVKWKVDPLPGWLSTQMRPCIISTRCREMARPRPEPPYLRVVEASAWLNDWNSFACCSGVMPMPVSRTQK
ncbi:MAG: hypothetical protein BWY66_00963 [bacterium ADurb.Bin374]|nr:MAG: hypothetical protein BWY66_00963 [bacterium ADurb.Bin374]